MLTAPTIKIFLYLIEYLLSKNFVLKLSEPSDEILNCEAEGIMGPVAGIVGNIQASEVLKKILKIGKDLNNYILILNLLTLNFRKIAFKKKKKCLCE